MTAVSKPFGPTELRRVFGAFPSGVVVIAALVDGVPMGMAASSFTSVSLDPPLVSICTANTSTTWPVLCDAPSFGVSVLAADQEEAGRQLAARNTDRFANLGWRATADGAVILDGASAWLRCSIHTVHPGGDHEIVVLRIHELEGDHTITPLVFHASKFHRLEVGCSVLPGSQRGIAVAWSRIWFCGRSNSMARIRQYWCAAA